MANVSNLEREMDAFQAEFRRVHHEISKVIVGYSDVIDDILMAILGKGHVLLEGVPGLGKTKLVQTLSDALHLRSSRTSFLPMRSIARLPRPNRRCWKQCKRRP